MSECRPGKKQCPQIMAKAEREKRWLADNREAIDSINSFIDRHGLLASRLRYKSTAPRRKCSTAGGAAA
jgi:hypothetical protein